MQIKANDLDLEIPPEVVKSAMLVREWFDMQGISEWKFMGIQSRREDLPLTAGRIEVESRS